MKLSKIHLTILFSLAFLIGKAGDNSILSNRAFMPPIEICSNGIDDDGDGLIDAFDPDCQETVDCFVQGVEQDFTVMYPEIHCSAVLSAPSAYSSPIAGDVDGDGEVEILLINHQFDKLMIISGVDCSIEAEYSFPTSSFANKAGNIALGDVDSDGYIDIFVAYGKTTASPDPQGIKRIEFNGSAYVEVWSIEGVATADAKHLDIIDLNQDGIPEIIPNGGFMVNSITGAQYAGVLPSIEGGINGAKGLYAYSADADVGNNGNEGNVELIRGVSIYRYDFSTNAWNLIREIATHSALWNDQTKVSLADLDLDGDVDAVVGNHENNGLLAWDLQTTTIFAEESIGGPLGISRASIGNFDDDPEPEFVYIQYNSLKVIDDIVNSNATVLGFSNLWSLAIVDPSAHTQVTLFDFDYDGKKEIVYRGETALRIFRGDADTFGNAEEIYNSGASTITSETGMEYPVIVDANGDGQANILTISDSNGSLGEGLHIFKSSGDPWGPSRKIWNTQAYSTTNVNDDGTIPAVMQENYRVYNDFQSQQGPFTPLPPDKIPSADLIMNLSNGVGIDGIIYDNCPDYGIALEICNQGDAMLSGNLSVELYDGDPYINAAAVYIGNYSLNTPIDTSECILDTVFFTPNPSTNYDFHFFINHIDPTSSYPLNIADIEREHLECDYTNNSFNHEFSCNRPPDLVNDPVDVCSEIAIDIPVLDNDTDVDNNIDAATLSISTNPVNGTANIVAGEIVYTSNVNFSGLDSVEYQLSDTGFPVYTRTAWAVINVIPANDAGVPASVSLCQSEPQVDLVTLLGGTPDIGGEWADGLGNLQSNIFDPAVDVGQILTYSFPSAAACSGTSTVDITIVNSNTAGTGGTFNVCETANQFNMITLLTGVNTSSGSWFDSSLNAVSTLFNPGTTSDGTYSYRVPADGSCPASEAFVTITTVGVPSAGADGSLTLCENSSAEDLLSNLGGTPDTDGIWSFGGIDLTITDFDPLVNTPGVYTYTASSNGSCPKVTSELTVAVNSLSNAGLDASVPVCNSTATVDLTSVLNGTPDPGGQWYDDLGNAIGTSFNTTPAGTYDLMYVVFGQSPCPNDTTYLELEVQQQLSAGTGDTYSVCENGSIFDLNDGLSAGAYTGGSWIDPNNNIHNGIINPSLSVPGQYVYQVINPSACIDETAVFTVNIESMPNAGDNGGNAFLCDIYTGFDLLSYVQGTPQPDGYFTDPNGDLVTDFSSPSGHLSGFYTYHANPTGICPETTSLLEVTISITGSAGIDTDRILCDNTVDVDLTSLLNGSPDMDGQWIDESNSLIGNIYTPTGPVTLTYRKNGGFPCPTIFSTLEITLSEMVYAGDDASISFCEIDANYNLVDYLSGNTGNGYWQNPMGDVISDTEIEPGVSLVGDYLYLTTPSNSCPQDTAIVSVATQNLPNAGESGYLLECSISDPIDLISMLHGSPDADGVWIGPNNTIVPSEFDPSSDEPGNYTYQVEGIFPCPVDASTSSVEVITAPYAGEDVMRDLCSTDDVINIETLMHPDATPERRWADVDGNLIINPVEDPSDTQGSQFLLIASGDSPCVSDTAVFTINVLEPVELSQTTQILLCEVGSPIDLENYVLVSNAVSYEFRDENSVSMSNEFDPSNYSAEEIWLMAESEFPCPADSIRLDITVNTPENPGVDTLAHACSTDVPFDVFEYIGGKPSQGGTFVWENDTTDILEFDPSINTGSHFVEYIAQSSSPCASGSSLLQIDIHQSPDPQFSVDGDDSELSNPLFHFYNETGGNYNFTWDFSGLGTAQTFNVDYTFPVDVSSVYQVCLHAEDVFDCGAEVCEEIEVKDVFSYFIPNTFTPNSDGDNDLFLIRGREIDPNFFELLIYSRAGIQVFHTKDLDEGWDGTWLGEHLPTDIYSYRLRIKAKSTSKRKEIMGHIALLH